MPNRIIKEGICISDDMASLSWFEQILFIRLIVVVDDYGRMDARPAILRGRMFPLESVTEKAISDALTKLSNKGMVNLYDVGGKPFLCLTAWGRHQSPPRAKDSKYPAPAEQCEQPRTSARKCAQARADVTVSRDSLFVNRDSINDIRSDDYNNTAGARACEEETSLEGTQEPHIPLAPEIFMYFKEQGVDNASGEAIKFEAYNNKRQWDCLKENADWKASADLWISRIPEHSKNRT